MHPRGFSNFPARRRAPRPCGSLEPEDSSFRVDMDLKFREVSPSRRGARTRAFPDQKRWQCAAFAPGAETSGGLPRAFSPRFHEGFPPTGPSHAHAGSDPRLWNAGQAQGKTVPRPDRHIRGTPEGKGHTRAPPWRALYLTGFILNRERILSTEAETGLPRPGTPAASSRGGCARNSGLQKGCADPGSRLGMPTAASAGRASSRLGGRKTSSAARI